ncbi:MAG: hypothetical protein GXO30_03075 [Epsilonproteobacteria bacterium]|nr:hypothetical protein [Campylobacterota bacterium]
MHKSVDTKDSSAPYWILNPNQNGKIGAVGSAMRTYDQKLSSQRKLAITRALDELSLQKGVKVSMRLLKEDIYQNNRGSSTMDVNASYNTNNSISAHIQAIYKDKLSGELFIWMLMD